jgi:hypothetical protein
MSFSRLAQLSVAFVMVADIGCTKTLPEEGPLTATSEKVTVVGEYKRIDLDSVERMSIENGKLVLHGSTRSLAVDLPPAADPDQKNRGWALVTEGEADEARTLTFTQEMSLDDFTIAVPPGGGQIAYGSLGGRDGHDVVLFAYGAASKAYWGWASITKTAGQ